ncbi:MAG: primosomal protein N' [Paludibacteraceae bacterium]|nr:primosomal protein N' [Paludibacteraceae bacterium]
MRLLDIILPLAIRDCYTYSVPDDWAVPAPGTRVVVPLMKKELRGVVLRTHTEAVEPALMSKIRPVSSVVDTAPVVSHEQLALWQWMSAYYMCTLGEVMAAALPGGLDKRLVSPPKRRRATLAPYTGPIEPMHDLSPAQAKSADGIETLWSSGKEIVLLHGVTSSGKTDIYIHLIQKQLAQGKNVLYLVPEIALTTQLTSRLQRIFGNQLMVYHSRFTDAEREQLYHASAKSEPHVVIGARSAIFLPIPDLGLVIVDEENEPSYKQAEPAPRYHARAAAIVLAREHHAKVLLGTATPSMESYYLAHKGVYGLVSLKERFGGVQLPAIQLIDLKRQYERKEMYGHFSDPLVERIRQTLAEHKQVILFQNRRGYAPQLQCTSCGQPPRCVQCDVPMTLHKRANELRCHYCGYSMPVPPVCPQCGGELKAIGFGTERIEDEIQTLFPDARVLRMDLDTTRNKSAYQDIINAFGSHECDILVGTQMVTKGLHFDDVRLVAVLNADPLFNQPDFRAYERAFQMLEQVAGRAGRKGNQGEVWIQTFDPTNKVLQMVQNHDYEALYRQQIAERQTFQYPPFHRLIRVQMRDHNSSRVAAFALQLQQHLTRIFGKRVSAVIVPSVERVQAYTLRELTLRIEQGANMVEAKRRIKEGIDYIGSMKSNKNVKIIIDIDPI